MTVTSQSVAAVVTPATASPFFRIVPPPIKPTPVSMPSGSRIKSITTKDCGVFPLNDSRILVWIMATDAARQTNIVVRNPAAWPRAPLLKPMIAPASIVSARRTQISLQLGDRGISIAALARHHIWNAHSKSTFRDLVVLTKPRHGLRLQPDYRFAG